MSWRLAFHSAKLLFSYLIPYKVKIFRDAIFDGNMATIRQLAAERPRLLQQSIDGDGNTALGSLMIDLFFCSFFFYNLIIRFGNSVG
jgi:hypothetical protein